jgi:catechol 2,3-dioxygenase-like lactoylglutathione lyase family enzyme
MSEPAIVGIHHVKFPVTALARSRDWYEQVFNLTPLFEFADEDGVVLGVAYQPIGPDGVAIALRENPEVARAIAGFDPVSFAIADRAAADSWIHRLDALDIAHSPVIDATIGWLVVFQDPDGTDIHLYSVERHGLDQTGKARRGRAAATA